MQWLLLVALVLFFIALLMNDTSKAWKLRLASAAIFIGVFTAAVIVVEARVHPYLSVVALVIAAFAAYGVLEFRKRLKLRKPEPFVEYLNLRSMGKRPVDVNDHPEAFGPNEGGAAEDRHESA